MNSINSLFYEFDCGADCQAAYLDHEKDVIVKVDGADLNLDSTMNNFNSASPDPRDTIARRWGH